MILQRFLVAVMAFTILGLAVAPPSAAADPPTPGWYFDGDLGGVWTGGNAESEALGAGFLLRRIWPQYRLRFGGSMSQTQTTNSSRTAAGTIDDFEVNEVKTTEKATEFYNLTAAGLYDISAHFFVLGGVDWMRNRPAGIDSRTLLAAGAGNIWADSDALAFRTFYNFTYTFQDDVVANPITNNEFPGLQVGYDYYQQITESARFESDAVVDFNLDNTDDIRVNWFGAIPVSISSRLELKPSLRVLWRNDPSLEEIPLDSGGTVLNPLSEWDTIFTLALVIKFEPDAEG